MTKHPPSEGTATGWPTPASKGVRPPAPPPPPLDLDQQLQEAFRRMNEARGVREIDAAKREVKELMNAKARAEGRGATLFRRRATVGSQIRMTIEATRPRCPHCGARKKDARYAVCHKCGRES